MSDSDMNIPIVDQSELELENLPIGRGGYGTVFRGKHREFGHVAVKTLINNGHLPKKHLDVLQAEAKKLMEFCQHDGILQLHGLVMQRDNYSLILEYMPLGSLVDFRKQFSPQFPLYVRFVMEVSSAMDFLHSRHPIILHLDLKADNILLDGGMHAKVSDFGLSEWKTVTMTATRRTENAESSGRRCTVSHVPPEVWSNINTPSDRFYDIYSFGICIWEMLTGAVPYGNAIDSLVRSAVLSGQRPDCSLIPTGCPPLLTKTMTRCWHQKPTQRPSFGTLKKEIEGQYDKEFKYNISTAMKNVRREIKESYPPDDLAYIYTSHIDHLPEPEPSPGPSSGQQVSGQRSSTSTNVSTSAGTQQQSTSQGHQTPEVMETEDEGPVQSVLFKKDMTQAEMTFRKLLRDPLALLVARSKYCKDFFNLDSKYKAILNSDQKLKRYLDEDEVFKKEILCPGNDFWRNVSGIHLRMSKERGLAWKQAHIKDLESISKKGRYGKTDWAHNNIETPRTHRRERVEKTNREHPHIMELKKGGSFHRVKKALENPRMFETLMRTYESGSTSNPLSLTTLDPEVIKLAKDPVLLLSLLNSEYGLQFEMMKPENQDLLLKLVGEAKQKNPLPGGGYITKPNSGRSRFPMGMYEDMMAHDMYRSDPMMMREMEMMMRHHPHMMDSDEEDDYPVMSSRGLPRRLLEMIRPSRKDPMRMMRKMDKAYDKEKGQAKRIGELSVNRDIRKRTFPLARNLSASATVTSSTTKDEIVSLSESPENNQSNTDINSFHSDKKIQKLSTADTPFAKNNNKGSIATIPVTESIHFLSSDNTKEEASTSVETGPVIGEENQEQTSIQTEEST